MPVRRSRLVLIPPLLAAALLAACAAPEPSQVPQNAAAQQHSVHASVDVQFVDPSSFAEMRGSHRQRDSDEWMNELRAHLEQRAPRYLPPRTRLLIRFTDIKLAGEYEPWRRPGLNDVRIVRDIYPPRLDLDYRLLDEHGATVREGSATLRDPSFLMRAQRYPNDPLGHEKLMLDDWLQSEFQSKQ